MFQISLETRGGSPGIGLDSALTGGGPDANSVKSHPQHLTPQEGLNKGPPVGVSHPQEAAIWSQNQSGGRCVTSTAAGGIAEATSGIPGLNSFRLRLGAGPARSASPLKDTEAATGGKPPPTIRGGQAFGTGLSKMASQGRWPTSPQARSGGLTTSSSRSSIPKCEYKGCCL